MISGTSISSSLVAGRIAGVQRTAQLPSNDGTTWLRDGLRRPGMNRSVPPRIACLSASQHALQRYKDDPLRIARFDLEQGSWPPPQGAILVERDALAWMGAHVGDVVTLTTPNGAPQTMQIAGRVHDPGLSPATEEDSAYAYISAEALPSLGDPAQRDQLKLTVVDDSDRQGIERTATGVATFLQAQGLRVDNIQIPPELYPASAFVSERTFAQLTGQHDEAQLIQIVTTQLGVMHSLGATPATIRRMVVYEGVLISALSAVLGVLLGLHLSLLEGSWSRPGDAVKRGGVVSKRQV